MAPAIKLAREGFALTATVSNVMTNNFDIFNQPGYEWMTNDGLPYAEGDIFKNEDLANTLEKIAEGGIDEFYKGDLAQTIVDGLQAGGSLITMEDMENYTCNIKECISTNYYGYDVVTTEPPSNGGDWLLEALNIMEEHDVKSMGYNTPEYLFTMNEALRIGLVDCLAFAGDPAFFDLPIDQMISKEYGAERAKLIPTDGKAVESYPAGDLPVSKLATADDGKHTSHISVMDSYGNVVSTTNTLGNAFGCTFSIPGTGFFWNSHMANLEHDPAKSDSSDYVIPGKRVRSTMAPTIIFKDGEPVMAVGSPGSWAIPPAIATVINNVLLFDMSVQEAINASRVVVGSRNEGELMLDEIDAVDPATLQALEDMGYTLSSGAAGYPCAVYRGEDGYFYAGGDPARDYHSSAY